jgi:predicted Zn-ribbon and HTH transcriptional regulator
MSKHLRLLDASCKYCGFHGKIVVVQVPSNNSELVKSFRIWQKGNHKGIEVQTMAHNK